LLLTAAKRVKSALPNLMWPERMPWRVLSRADRLARRVQAWIKLAATANGKPPKASQQQRGGKQSSTCDSFLLAFCCVSDDADDDACDDRVKDHSSGFVVHLPNPDGARVLRGKLRFAIISIRRRSVQARNALASVALRVVFFCLYFGTRAVVTVQPVR
jgi:hypothetical protein